MSIIDAVYSYLPAKKKNTPSGWTKFNAVCCQHNGNTVDTRQRGGVIRNAEGVSYHCFNCGFKASYVAGRHLTRKMRQLLSWLGASDDIISKLSLEALKIQADTESIQAVTLPVFVDKPLPEKSKSFDEWATFLSLTDDAYISPNGLKSAVEYIDQRGLAVRGEYPFYWSSEMPDRVIIPFIYEGKIVGWTGRKLTDGKPKYLSDQTPGFVFNLDAQQNNRPVVLVVEGPIDALSVDAVGILGADIMDKQALLINRLGKRVIVVPDRDSDGSRTVEQAIELGWAVSMPKWAPGIKDCNDAVRHYGKLATVAMIIKSAEQSSLKIKLRAKTWFEQKE